MQSCCSAADDGIADVRGKLCDIVIEKLLLTVHGRIHLQLGRVLRGQGLLARRCQNLIISLLVALVAVVIHLAAWGGRMLLQTRRAEQAGTKVVHGRLSALPATIVLGLHQVKMAALVLLHDPILRARSLDESLKGPEGGDFGELGVMAGDGLNQSA